MVSELSEIREAVELSETPITDLVKALIGYIDALNDAQDNSE